MSLSEDEERCLKYLVHEQMKRSKNETDQAIISALNELLEDKRNRDYVETQTPQIKLNEKKSTNPLEEEQNLMEYYYATREQREQEIKDARNRTRIYLDSITKNKNSE